jgi:RND family efflux transporter MFP subunit
MKSYRVPFLIAVAANIVVLAALAGYWWNTHAMGADMSAEARQSDSGMSSMPSMSAPGSMGAASTGAPPAAPEEAEPTLAPLQISSERLQSIGVSMGEVRREAVDDKILTTGNVAVPETGLATVQVRFSGYIQTVFADATYRYVHEGQPLFTIYSPELVSAEREYLLAKQSQRGLARVADSDIASDAASIVDAAAARLRQWNIPEREIARLESTGKVQQNLEIDSPVSGYITEREALPNKFAQPGTPLYTVADLSTVWVFAQVFQSDLGRLKAGDPATLTVDTFPGRTFSGRVDFIYPDIDLMTRTARVRLVFPNPRLELTPGMFVSVSLQVPMGEREVIPASGVLQTGTRQIVFVSHGGGSLEPREVQLGARVGDDYIVQQGVKAGDRIVTSANFLIDSESQLQAALGSFAPPPPGASRAESPGTRQAKVDLSSDPSPPRKGSNVVRVKLTGADGSPIVGAQVSVTLFMAAMPAMGMAAMRVPVTLTDRGNGLYEGSAQLGSGGTWQVIILAKKNDQVVASNQLSVSVTGGM